MSTFVITLSLHHFHNDRMILKTSIISLWNFSILGPPSYQPSKPYSLGPSSIRWILGTIFYATAETLPRYFYYRTKCFITEHAGMVWYVALATSGCYDNIIYFLKFTLCKQIHYIPMLTSMDIMWLLLCPQFCCVLYKNNFIRTRKREVVRRNVRKL